MSIVLCSVALCAAAVVFDAANSADRIFAGDPHVYRARVAEMMQNGLPYIDVPFEHLPVMLVPMLIPWFLGGAESPGIYTSVFGVLMTICIGGSTVLIQRIGESLGDRAAGWRWLLLSAPLLPLVLFRNDPVAVVLALLAVLAITDGRPGWWIPAFLGGLAKIWPSAVASLGWKRQLGRSAAAAAGGVAGLALSFAPSFASARNAVGLHTETIVGAIVGLVRAARDGSAEVLVTTAAYLNVPGWVVAVNTLLGLGVVGLALLAMSRQRSAREGVVALGAVVIGVIMTSNLFSLQYVLWVLPFLAFDRRKVVLLAGLALSLLTGWLAWVWSVKTVQHLDFYVLVSVRNLVLLLVAWLCVSPARLPSGVDELPAVYRAG